MAINHGLTEMPDEFVERARSKLNEHVDRTGDCHVWSGPLNDKGYGVIRFPPSQRTVGAHRVSWLLDRGPIPEGMVLDHLCMNPVCVNVAHLEIVTQSENVRRAIAHHQAAGTGRWSHLGDVCRKGIHEMTEENRYAIRKAGVFRGYTCRACTRESNRLWRAANPERTRAYEARKKRK